MFLNNLTMLKLWIFMFGYLLDYTYCTEIRDGDVRLVGGTSSNEGRIEIFYQIGWGTVCDDNWGITDADVVCKQLGYVWAVDAKVDAYYGRGSGAILLDNVECFGSEDALYNCRHNGVYNHDCVHGEDAGVVCETNSIEPEDGLLRLTGDADGTEGLLDIMYRGVWGSVCPDDFDLNDANVACIQLGFAWAIDFYIGDSYSTCWSWITEVECDGTESRLLECEHNGLYQQQDCSLYESVNIVCSYGENVDEFPKYLPVRLRNGKDDSRGRVETYTEGAWGTVCDNAWGIDDADVVCRQLGYEGADEAKRNAFFGEGSGPIHFKGFRCDGGEHYLSACMSNYVKESDLCSHTDDAGVVCFDDDSDHDSYSFNSSDYDSNSVISEQSSVITACDSNPCVNGVCVTSSSSLQYICSCNIGWTGTACNIEITACDSNPCFNGTCYLEPSSEAYHCTCYDGWTGEICDQEIVGCGLEPCLNGGLCESLSATNDELYKCDCLYAWMGTRCETERNGCNLYLCLNNGECFDIVTGGYQCRCMAGYAGDNCEIVETPCDSNPCRYGNCLIVPNDNTYFCYCDEGWTGQHCEEEVNLESECSSNPCLHGICLVYSSEGYLCSCYDGWTGVNCETCFIGQDCQTVESVCDSSPCINGGCLDVQSSMTFYCLCNAGWTGILCDTEIACINNPCANAVVCIDHTDGQYTCICQTGWIGDNCDEYENAIETTTSIIDEQTPLSTIESPDSQTTSNLSIGIIIVGAVVSAIIIIIASILLVWFLRNRQSSLKPVVSGVENQTYDIGDSKPPINGHDYDNSTKKEYNSGNQSTSTNGSNKHQNEYLEPNGNTYEEIQDIYMELSPPRPNVYIDLLPSRPKT